MAEQGFLFAEMQLQPGDYEGKGFESCLFFEIPESFKKLYFPILKETKEK